MTDGELLPGGQACPNEQCPLDDSQRWTGFHGLACPECACQLLIACRRCSKPAVWEHEFEEGRTRDRDRLVFCEDHGPDDRLFVPLKTEPYRHFENGAKDIELRGINNAYNRETVAEGKAVELRRGYSTPDRLWGTITQVWTIPNIEDIAVRLDHTRIQPLLTREEFEESVSDMLGQYDAYIPFEVDVVGR